MKKNIIFISIILLNLIIIGFLLYQNNYLNTKFNEIDKKLETLSDSNEQQDLQISQLTNNIIETKQNQALKDLEKGTDESIFENIPTDGLIPITEDEAKKIWEEYLTNTLSKNINDYNVNRIETVMAKPSNRFTAGAESNVRTADFERKAYLFNYTQKDNMGEITGYVDVYTGKVIGGFYNGD